MERAPGLHHQLAARHRDTEVACPDPSLAAGAAQARGLNLLVGGPVDPLP